MRPSRRALLEAAAGAGALALAGCLDATPFGVGEVDAGDEPAEVEGPEEDESEEGSRNETQEPTEETGHPPFAERDLYVGHDLDTIDENIQSGGVTRDGIPSIDDPAFGTPADVDLDPGDPVFGVVRGGEARAYPQYVLVWHEIVNDTVGGEPVAVTYCPLTGTAQGFERGDVEFGVSGRLVNSNLVMYDRGSDTWWPQIIATGVRGPHRGETLEEFRVVWTSWGEWSEKHPDTRVLTEDTGYTRRYGSDPYGAYNPKSGYYESEDTMFPPLARTDDEHSKEVVVGARTAAGAIAFNKDRLLEERVLTADLDGVSHVAVADESLTTGYVYANPDSVPVEDDGGGYRVDDASYDPDDLPLDRVLAFDAMWFAWYGFYPDTEYVD